MAIQYPEKVNGGAFYLGDNLTMATKTVTDLENDNITKTFKVLDINPTSFGILDLTDEDAITENGSYEFTPKDYDLVGFNSVNIEVDVSGSGGNYPIKLANVVVNLIPANSEKNNKKGDTKAVTPVTLKIITTIQSDAPMNPTILAVNGEFIWEDGVEITAGENIEGCIGYVDDSGGMAIVVMGGTVKTPVVTGDATFVYDAEQGLYIVTITGDCVITITEDEGQ